jgi:hypothetical protein
MDQENSSSAEAFEIDWSQFKVEPPEDQPADARPLPSGDAPVFPPGSGPCVVSLVEHPDPRCRMRAMLGLRRGEAIHVYEIRGADGESSLVSSVLGAAGIGGARPMGTARCFRVDDTDALVHVMSFVVPESVDPATIEEYAGRLLSGEVRGFLPVVMGQNAFHFADGQVFEALWRAAGQPRIHVSKAEHVESTPGAGLVEKAMASKSFRAVFNSTHDPDETESEAAAGTKSLSSKDVKSKSYKERPVVAQARGAKTLLLASAEMDRNRTWSYPPAVRPSTSLFPSHQAELISMMLDVTKKLKDEDRLGHAGFYNAVDNRQKCRCVNGRAAVYMLDWLGRNGFFDNRFTRDFADGDWQPKTPYLRQRPAPKVPVFVAVISYEVRPEHRHYVVNVKKAWDAHTVCMLSVWDASAGGPRSMEYDFWAEDAPWAYVPGTGMSTVHQGSVGDELYTREVFTAAANWDGNQCDRVLNLL